MPKLKLVDAVDSDNKPAGWIIMAEGDDETIWGDADECETLEQAQKELARIQAEVDLDEKIQASYLEWERPFLQQHETTSERLRDYLANAGWWHNDE